MRTDFFRGGDKKFSARGGGGGQGEENFGAAGGGVSHYIRGLFLRGVPSAPFFSLGMAFGPPNFSGEGGGNSTVPPTRMYGQNQGFKGMHSRNGIPESFQIFEEWNGMHSRFSKTGM